MTASPAKFSKSTISTEQLQEKLKSLYVFVIITKILKYNILLYIDAPI